jgi:hypothetical protein
MNDVYFRITSKLLHLCLGLYWMYMSISETLSYLLQQHCSMSSLKELIGSMFIYACRVIAL